MQKYISSQPFPLESGGILPSLEIGYQTFGERNAKCDNVLWVFHALTANADVSDWWHGLFGAGKALDPSRYFIVCANVLGSCYGSSNPTSQDPRTGKPYYGNFPRLVTIRDMVQAHRLLAQHLGIQQIALGIGGSLGGQQLLEWAVQEPERFERILPIATNAKHSPWGIAFNESQRLALEADPTLWYPSRLAGKAGLKAARAMALLSYRNYQTYQYSQADTEDTLQDFKAVSYQRYQGDKLVARFHAQSYYVLSKAMDAHDVGRGRGGVAEALARVQAQARVVGIRSDVLFPIEEQQLIAQVIPNAQYVEIDSDYGHDGFLIEWELLNAIVLDFLSPIASKNQKFERNPLRISA
ncbi:MAG: homoserine O-acetyltransferase [Bernardetiaceae bacterium]